jgi:hypothetical protein
MRWAGHVALVGEMRNACKGFFGKPGGNRPLERTKCRWQDDIKTDLTEIVFEVVYRIHLVQDREQ